MFRSSFVGQAFLSKRQRRQALHFPAKPVILVLEILPAALLSTFPLDCFLSSVKFFEISNSELNDGRIFRHAGIALLQSLLQIFTMSLEKKS
jgi:hypothetical protein